jgi:hypothetical protein
MTTSEPSPSEMTAGTPPQMTHAGKRSATSFESGETSSSKEPKRPCVSSSDAAVPATAPQDELIAAAPKLAEAIRSAAKCVKVAEKVASLLEEGRVKLSNAGAVFEILSAAVEDPTRWRKPSGRPAFRRLLIAADARLNLFPLHMQQSIKVWKLRVVTVIDLLANHPEQFSSAFHEVAKLLRRLPCDNPAHEPRSSAQPGYSHLLTGVRQDYLPERSRPTWCAAIFECLEVAVTRFEGPQLWARPEVNTLIKLAAERRANFLRARQEVNTPTPH